MFLELDKKKRKYNRSKLNPFRGTKDLSYQKSQRTFRKPNEPITIGKIDGL